jgi:hypothetical protein
MRRNHGLRQRIAQEAARIMTEDHVSDFHAAKLKAARRLGIHGERDMPRNREIEQALLEYRSLFQSDAEAEYLRHLRRTALQAMTLFRSFRPRLVGAVLKGTAGSHAAVGLHLFADAPEEVSFHLMERGIPYELDERRLRMRAGGEYQAFPLYRFMAGDVPMELTVFPSGTSGHAPISPVDGRPMRRAGRSEVEALLDE